MSFAGNLKTIAFSDILQLVSTGKKTGRLMATHASQKKELFFRNGNLISATSSNTQEDMIGNLLVRMGKINKADLQKAVNIQQQSGRRIGAVMLELGLLTKPELAQYLKIQVEEIVYNLFSWSEGEFSFQDELKPPDDQILVNLETMNLIMEGTRRIDEWLEIRKALPEPSRLLKPVLNPNLRGKDLTLTAEEYQILMMIDGAKTFADLMENSPLGDFLTAKSIYTLLNLGLIQPGAVGESQLQVRQESEQLLYLVAKVYSASYSALERIVARKLGGAKTKLFYESYQAQKEQHPLIAGAVRDGYNLDQEFIFQQISKMPPETRLFRLIQALNSLLFQFLKVVSNALGENVVRVAVAEVKKEMALILLENSELNKKYDLENELLGTLRLAEL
jgi:hypothetical protein